MTASYYISLISKEFGGTALLAMLDYYGLIGLRELTAQQAREYYLKLIT